MKFLNKIWGVGLIAFMLIMAAPGKSIAQNDYISDQDFYDNLAPYGTWVNDPQYGDVWVPDVDGDFRPYATQGHWVLTEYGNTWASDYPWGWATFHYGRWRFDDYYGWEWIPGYDWAPAWVSWRQGGGYYGWAPLSPGIDISISLGGGNRIPNDYWTFAPQAYITSPYIYNYYVPHTRVVNIIRNATVINNYYSNGGNRYIAGPRVQDIQRVTHRRPEIYSINNTNRPGAINITNKTVNIYRPAVRRAPDARPERVVDGNAYKQQNPDQRIARRGQGGAAAYNHDNAAKLAGVAHSAAPNTNVVRVNNRPNNNQPGNAPNNNQPGNREQQNRSGQNNVQPGNAPNNNQPGNREQQNRPGQNNAQPGNAPNNNGQPGNRGFRGRPEDRPNIAPPANNAQPPAPAQGNPAAPAQNNPAQPGNRPDNGQRGRNGAQFNRQGQNDAAAPQQAAQQQQQTQQQQAQQQQAQRQQQDAQRQQMMQQRQQQAAQQQQATQQAQQQQNVQQQQAQRQQMIQQRQQQQAQRQQMIQQRQQQQQAQQQDVRRQQQQAQQAQQQQAQQQAAQQQQAQRQQQQAQQVQQQQAQQAQRQQQQAQQQQAQQAQRQQQQAQQQQQQAQRQQQAQQQAAQRQQEQQQKQQQQEQQRQARPAKEAQPQ